MRGEGLAELEEDASSWHLRYFRERLDRLQLRTAQLRAMLPSGDGLHGVGEADMLRREAVGF